MITLGLHGSSPMFVEFGNPLLAVDLSTINPGFLVAIAILYL